MQTIEVVVGLCTLVIALGTILWQLSATLTALRKEREEMAGEIGEMKKAIGELKVALERLDKVPLHEQRIAQLERIVEHLQAEISTLWRKVFSVDRHIAVQRAISQHDIDDRDNDTEPPPRE